ncbi:hypothetical protein [Metabacillus indicus]|uniref:hypothetical protein n=1 Tax=Metabacillus indicus TaxID=246786 RepID=UPI003CFA23A7
MKHLLKIDPKYRRNQLPVKVQMQLDYFPVHQVKFMVAVITFLLIDLIFLIPMIFSGVKILIYITLPLVIAVNLWAIALLVRSPERTAHEMLLFFCFSGIAGAVCFLSLTMMYAYFGGIESLEYFFMMLMLFLVTIVWSFYKQLNKYSKLKDRVKETPAWQGNLYSIVIPAAYLFAHFVLGLSESIALFVMLTVYLILAGSFILILTKSFHKYLFIKYNPHLKVNRR